MPEIWVFFMKGDMFELVCRPDCGSGMLGDARVRIGPNEPIVHPPGLTYAALAAIGDGTLKIFDNQSFKVSPLTAAERARVEAMDEETEVSNVTDEDLKELFHPDLLVSIFPTKQ